MERKKNGVLQWGHVFSDVEITGGAIYDGSRSTRFNGATSFQTWKWSRWTPSSRARPVLQWGHVFSDVEIYVQIARTAIKFGELQWGHVFSDVEIRFHV